MRAIKRSEPSCQAGWSLTELLVVLVLVPVLAALLLPAAGRVSERSIHAKCLSNLRQIGTAIAAFSSENNGHLPGRYLLVPGVEVNPPLPDRYWTSRFLRSGYLSDPNVLYCPGAFPRRHADAKSDIESDGGQTYGMRVWCPPNKPWNHRNGDHLLASIKRPSEFFLVADSVWMQSSGPGKPVQGYSINPSPTSNDNQRIHLRHGGKAFALFADFHVAAIDEIFIGEIASDRQAEYNNGFRFSILLPNDPIP